MWDFLDERRLITCRHHVVGPTYTDVRTKTRVVGSAQVREKTLRDRIGSNLQAFFHPILGGPGAKKTGWPFGRDVYVSEVYQIIEETEGIDHVEFLALEGRSEDEAWTDGGDRVNVPPNNLVSFDAQSSQISVLPVR